MVDLRIEVALLSTYQFAVRTSANFFKGSTVYSLILLSVFFWIDMVVLRDDVASEELPVRLLNSIPTSIGER